MVGYFAEVSFLSVEYAMYTFENTPYGSSINQELLSVIPGDAQLILDIGCGQGALGAEFKRRHPECCYWAVEPNPEAAEMCRPNVDRVVVGDAGSPELNEVEGKVDCIVYGDVLEHLLDPWSVVRDHVRLLRPGGAMVCSIPNVQHWTMLQDLLRGDWTYSESGLLDRTHLRFFTYKTVSELFVDAGMTISLLIGRMIDRPEAEKFAELAAPLMEPLGIDANQFKNQISIFQYILIAKKPLAP